MNERITRHMDMLFESAPSTRKALELKEEMTQNANDKYQDLLADGYSEEAAYQNVIGSIGDVSELFEELEEKTAYVMSEADQRKKALITAISVVMYIFEGVVFLLCGWLDEMPGSRYMDYSTLGLVLAAAICIVPTCLLVYVANMYPNYKKEEDNMVEEYKEITSGNRREKAILGAISTIIWTVTIALYFIISFTTYAWYVTWVIFLMGACAEAIAVLVINMKSENR